MRIIQKWIVQHPVKADALAGWFQQGAGLGVGLFLVPIVLSHFTLAESGLWFGFQGMLGMVGLLDFGIGAVVARQAAHVMGGGRAKAGEDFLDLGGGDRGLRALIDHSAVIYLATSVLLLVAGALIFEFGLPRTRLLDGISIDARPVWYLMLMVPLCALLASRGSSLLIGTGHLFSFRIIVGLFFVAQGAAVGIVAWLFGDLRLMALVSALSAVCYAVAMTWCSRHLLRDAFRLPKIAPDWSVVRRLVKVAAPMGVVNISAFLFYSIQVPLIAMLLGPAVVAPFYLAQKILQAGMTAVQNLVQPQLPRFTRRISADDLPGARDILRKSLALGWPTVLFVAAMFVIFSPSVAEIFSKGDVYPVRSVLFWMAADSFLCICAAISNQFVLASGRNPFVVSTLVSGLLNVLFLCVLIPRMGIAGVPFSSMIAGGVATYWFAVYQLARLKRVLSIGETRSYVSQSHS